MPEESLSGHSTPKQPVNETDISHNFHQQSSIDVTVPDPFTQDTLTFNVGGKRFETYASTLDRDCNCLLSRKSFLQAHYRKDTGEYFFDRDPDVFKCILNYMRTSRLHLPTYVCGPAAKHEFEFWGLSPEKIEQCCWSNYNEWNVTHEALQRLERDRKVSLQSSNSCCEVNDQWNTNTRWTKQWQCRVWRFLNRPSSSRAAKVYGFVSLGFVLLSIFTFQAETTTLLTIYKTHLKNIVTNLQATVIMNATAYDNDDNITVLNDTHILTTREVRYKVKNPVVFYIDMVCLVYFIAEYIIRFIFAPRKCRFATSLLSLIDLFAIVPDLIEVILLASNSAVRENLEAVSFLNILRVMRICRIFRLFRHVPGLWILIYTLHASISELMLLIWFLVLGILLFSTLIYFVEGGDTFPSIPEGFWWAIVTMTTVGYGDVYPRTTAGKIIGCLCAISGLLMIGFTVPALVNNFSLYYRHIHFAVERNVADEKSKRKRNRHASTEQWTVLKNELINEIKQVHTNTESEARSKTGKTEHDAELKLLKHLNPNIVDRTVSETRWQKLHSLCANASEKCKTIR